VSERAISAERVSDHRKPESRGRRRCPAGAKRGPFERADQQRRVLGVPRLSSERRSDSPGVEPRSRLSRCRTPEGISSLCDSEARRRHLKFTVPQ